MHKEQLSVSGEVQTIVPVADPVVASTARTFESALRSSIAQQGISMPVEVMATRGVDGMHIRPEYTESVITPAVEKLVEETKFDRSLGSQAVDATKHHIDAVAAKGLIRRDSQAFMTAWVDEAQSALESTYTKKAKQTIHSVVGAEAYPVSDERVTVAAAKVREFTEQWSAPEPVKPKSRRTKSASPEVVKKKQELEDHARDLTLKITTVASDTIMHTESRGKGKRARTVEVMDEPAQQYAWDLADSLLEQSGGSYKDASKAISKARKYLANTLGTNEKEVLKKIRSRLNTLKTLDYFQNTVADETFYTLDAPHEAVRIGDIATDQKSIAKEVREYNKRLREEAKIQAERDGKPANSVRIDIMGKATEYRQRLALQTERLEAENAILIAEADDQQEVPRLPEILVQLDEVEVSRPKKEERISVSKKKHLQRAAIRAVLAASIIAGIGEAVYSYSRGSHEIPSMDKKTLPPPKAADSDDRTRGVSGPAGRIFDINGSDELSYIRAAVAQRQRIEEERLLAEANDYHWGNIDLSGKKLILIKFILNDGRVFQIKTKAEKDNPEDPNNAALWDPHSGYSPVMKFGYTDKNGEVQPGAPVIWGHSGRKMQYEGLREIGDEIPIVDKANTPPPPASITVPRGLENMDELIQNARVEVWQPVDNNEWIVERGRVGTYGYLLPDTEGKPGVNSWNSQKADANKWNKHNPRNPKFIDPTPYLTYRGSEPKWDNRTLGVMFCSRHGSTIPATQTELDRLGYPTFIEKIFTARSLYAIVPDTEYAFGDKKNPITALSPYTNIAGGIH